MRVSYVIFVVSASTVSTTFVLTQCFSSTGFVMLLQRGLYDTVFKIVRTCERLVSEPSNGELCVLCGRDVVELKEAEVPSALGAETVGDTNLSIKLCYGCKGVFWKCKEPASVVETLLPLSIGQPAGGEEEEDLEHISSGLKKLSSDEMK